MRNHFSQTEAVGAAAQQVFTLEKSMRDQNITIEEIGNLIPGNVLVTDLNELSTHYMNERGCNILKHSVEELKHLGAAYYKQFFVSEETDEICSAYMKMLENQDPTEIFNFAHRAKALDDDKYTWYFASAKLLFEPGKRLSDKMLLIVNEVESVGNLAVKINSALDETDWMKRNFGRFCRLSSREKEILTYLSLGRSSQEISDMLSLSLLTVHTHRRNIGNKLGVKSFAEMHKYAVTYGLIS